jgi:hypothetical protein
MERLPPKAKRVDLWKMSNPPRVKLVCRGSPPTG